MGFVLLVRRGESFLVDISLGGDALGGREEGGRGFPLSSASRLGGSPLRQSFEGFSNLVAFPPFQFRLLGVCLCSV